MSKKTYYNLETTLSLPGVSCLYCIVTAVSLILMYFILPETEGRSLEDIELHFSDDSKKLTDWKIAKIVPHEEYFKPNEIQNDNETQEPIFTITRAGGN